MNLLSSFKDAGLSQSPGSKCTPCPVVQPSPVCGTDGHSYSTKCKLEYQACITGKKIAVKCSGMCPCPAHPEQSPAHPEQSPAHPEQSSAERKVCGAADLKAVVSRLRDWFRVLRENGNHRRLKIQKPERSKLEVGSSPPCKDPLGWMFSRLDTNFDLQLDQSETRSLYLERNEPCGHALLRSCDAHADNVISSSEWCSCFQRFTDSPCQAERNEINKKQPGKKLLGQDPPSCGEGGYFRAHQCHSSSGQCWCVDRFTRRRRRTHGPAACGVVLESSGDLGSGDSLLPDDDEDDDEDSFVLNDRAGTDDERDEDEDYEDDDDDNDEYLS
ncbi:testican-3-like [Pseudoliparis swirei]|uniref:testican-3-like n=1 Tax=Pseudoliparis swirei TaxID=2059687 RepID=UPI0024BEDAF8|nr:testican-3-like [Pseudoliparis swirei]